MFKMKVLFVIAALFSAVLSGPAPQYQSNPEDDGANMEYFLVERSPGVYAVEDLVNSEINARVSSSDIFYRFFSQSDPVSGVDIRSNNIEALGNTRFSNSRDTLFIIHGWKDDSTADSNSYIKEAVLATHNINVFLVDWGPIADQNYISAKNSVVQVGQFLASFVRSLVSRYNVNLSRVGFVGFSLGAHVAGNAGAELSGAVELIVGLDPAGPLYSVSNTGERLDPTDAKFVQVIHTNGGTLGFRSPCGHADYYPNGGSSQPGCILDITGSCAHSRAYQYYSESISARTNGFASQQCTSYDDWTRGRCSSNSRSVLGGYSVDTSARGDYYLDTNRTPLYALG